MYDNSLGRLLIVGECFLIDFTISILCFPGCQWEEEVGRARGGNIYYELGNEKGEGGMYGRKKCFGVKL